MEEIKSPGERCGLHVGVKVQCRQEQGLTKGIFSAAVFVSVSDQRAGRCLAH